jgi:hypothetical protein
MVFDKKLKSCKIGGTDHPEFMEIRMEALKQYRSLVNRGDNLFDLKDYENAKQAYEQARTFKSDESYAFERIRMCNNFIEVKKAEKRKPLYLNFHIMPSITKIRLSGADSLPVCSSEFTFGGGMGLEYVFVKGEKSFLSAGLAVDYMTYKSSYTDDEYFCSTIITDKYNHSVQLLNKLEGVNEKIKLSSLEIPVYVNYKWFFAEKYFLYVKAGAKFGFILNKKYESQAKGDYKGQYNEEFHSIIYYDLINNYGINDVSVSDKDLDNFNGFNLSGFGGLGAGYEIDDVIQVQFGVSYSYGFSNLSEKNSGMLLSMNRYDLQSMSNLGNSNTSAIIFELGMNLKISK